MSDDQRNDLPPHDEAAEVAAIGAALLSAEALADVAAVCTPEDFYRPAHEQIVAAALHLAEAGEPVDAITVGAELDRRGQLHRIGGAPYLLTCIQSVPTATNASYYAELIASAAQRRRLLEAAHRVAVMARRPTRDTEESAALVDDARATLDAAARARSTGSASRIGDLADARLGDYESPAAAAIPTGWLDLDRMLGGGLRGGNLVVFGARPSVGKSVAVGQLALSVARSGAGVLWASLEMTRAECMDRVYAQSASVNLSHLVRHNLSDDDWQRVSLAGEELADVPLVVDDNPRQTIASLAGAAQAMQRDGGLSLLVVDYLQLVTPSDSRVPRREQVDAIARGLKLLAKRFNVPVVAAAQLSRAAADRRPGLADLREAGGIEQDSDVVVLLHPDEENVGTLDFIVAKNRQGRTGDLTLAYQPHYARLADLARAG